MLIENEYRRVMGEEIADFQLEFLMRECDSVSVGLAGRLAQAQWITPILSVFTIFGIFLIASR